MNAATNDWPHGPTFRPATHGQASASSTRLDCSCMAPRNEQAGMVKPLQMHYWRRPTGRTCAACATPAALWAAGPAIYLQDSSQLCYGGKPSRVLNRFEKPGRIATVPSNAF